MDILYIVGQGSRHNNLELRMSLRSICRYASNIGKIIVAGNPPNWLSDEIIKVSVKDQFSYKHQNILKCIETIIDMKLLNGDFLYSSDDHFYVKPVDFNHYPYFFKCDLRSSVNKTDPYYQYHRSLFDTRKLCEKHNLPTINFSQHCNTHMHTEVFKAIRPIVYESYSLPYGAEPTSLIMNAWQTFPNPPKTTKREDCKILSAKSIKSLCEQIGERDCFSISDSVFNNKAIKEFFNSEYGIKTILEKD